jgi:flavin-dependent dehydrogenase
VRPDPYDVLIAGGGYAAQVAARDLVAAGKAVLMVDRRVRPGWPPQSTSGLAREWVRRFRLPVSGETTPLTSFRMIGPGGEEAVLGGGLLGEVGETMVEPDLLARMEADSVRHGLDTIHGSTVLHAWPRGGMWRAEIRTPPAPDRVDTTVADARHLFDATGFQSWIGRQLGMVRDFDPEDVHGGVEVTVPRPSCHPPGEVRMWLGRRVAPWGYAWAFPSTENGYPHVRLGLGTPRAVAESAGGYFRRFQAAHPEYAGPAHHRVGGIIPTSPVVPTIERDGVFLLGDAARLCCPLTGGGIWGALASGEAAAAAVVAGDPSSYRRRLAWLTGELRARWALKQFAYGLTDSELARLVRFLGRLNLPADGSVNPLAERRRVTRRLLLEEPTLLATVLTRGRFWRALAG